MLSKYKKKMNFLKDRNSSGLPNISSFRYAQSNLKVLKYIKKI